MNPGEIQRLLRYLTPVERAELNALVARDMRAVLWRPLPGPQSLAYHSTADIIGFGGAAGGGKTDLGIGKALTQHRRVLVVRKNGTENTAMIDRMTEILGDRNGLGGNPPIWRREVDGIERQIEFIGVPNPGDEQKYRGRPHDLKLFDEAAELPEQVVRFLLAWLRTTVPGQKCQALLTFNPPSSAEGRWIIDFFAPWLDDKHPCPAEPGELRWFASINGKDVEVLDGTPFEHNGELITPLSRTFVPSRVTDNPFLMGTGYMAQLQALPEPLRSQMLYGDFKAGIKDDAFQVIPTAWVEAAMERWKPKQVKPPMDSMGVDVARGGDDHSVIARRHGNWYDELLAYPGKQTPDGPTVAGLVVMAARDEAPQHVDVIGVGASCYDFLRAARQHALGVNVAEASTATDKSGKLRFANLRSQLWWQLREDLDPASNRGTELPPDKRLLRELCAPRWIARGPIVYVESRDDIIKRLGYSPDYASAVILARIDTPKRPAATGGALGGSGLKGAVAEYDPLAVVRVNP